MSEVKIIYDTIIIGGGPAGLTSGIYLARAGVNTLILEKEAIGGQIATSPLIENYPGFNSISGSALADKMYEQVENLGVQIEVEEANKILNFKDEIKQVVTDYNTYECKTIIIATGSKYRKLNIDNEDNLIGRGIHFCTSCDAAFYKDKIVVVIGGANSAVTNAIYLADICKKIYLIYRKDKLKCETRLKEKILQKGNVEILYNSNVTKFIGEEKLEKIEIETSMGDKNSKLESREIMVDGVFESIGMDAQTEVASEFIRIDENKYFISKNCDTEIDGIFVAGDCREKELRQVVTATNDGAIAATKAIDYLKSK